VVFTYQIESSDGNRVYIEIDRDKSRNDNDSQTIVHSLFVTKNKCPGPDEYGFNVFE